MTSKTATEQFLLNTFFCVHSLNFVDAMSLWAPIATTMTIKIKCISNEYANK